MTKTNIIFFVVHQLFKLFNGSSDDGGEWLYGDTEETSNCNSDNMSIFSNNITVTSEQKTGKNEIIDVLIDNKEVIEPITHDQMVRKGKGDVAAEGAVICDITIEDMLLMIDLNWRYNLWCADRAAYPNKNQFFNICWGG